MQERRADVLPAARLLTRDERGEDAGGHEEHRGHARQGHVQEDRAHAPARLLPLLSAARLYERVVAGPVRPTVAFGVRGAGGVDEARIARVQRVEADAEPVGDAGPERLDQHVDVVGQLVERVAAGRVLQVERDGPARAVPHRVAAVVAERVATGRFDLDDIGTLFGEQQHAERTGDAPGQVEDAQIVQGSGHRWIFAAT